MAAPEGQWNSWLVVPLAHQIRGSSLRLRDCHAHWDMGSAQRFHGNIAKVVDSCSCDSVLAPHRAFSAHLAGYNPSQFLEQTSPLQRPAIGGSTGRTSPVLQLDRVYPHGDRDVLPHVPLGK